MCAGNGGWSLLGVGEGAGLGVQFSGKTHPVPVN